ncbi:MAG: hypothetical protein M0R39_17865 [Prolixibacteraceae bacterium]|nr:hypothetical protein [Prolixibacteraceae bacterium]
MKKRIFIAIASALILLTVLLASSPGEVSLPIYLAVFIDIYVFCVCMIAIIIDLAYGNLPSRQKTFMSLVLAFTPLSLLALETLSTVSLIDVVLAVGLPALLVWYGLKKI